MKIIFVSIVLICGTFLSKFLRFKFRCKISMLDRRSFFLILPIVVLASNDLFSAFSHSFFSLSIFDDGVCVFDFARVSSLSKKKNVNFCLFSYLKFSKFNLL